MKKEKVLILLMSLLLAMQIKAQVVNQPANWPDASWSINIIEDTDGLVDIEADPSVDPNFSFDDDDSGNNSHDIIAAESSVIDLTAAQAANENLISITSEYSYNWVDAEEYFAIEYWDADASSWVAMHIFPQEDVPGIGTDNWCSTGKRPYIGTLDISGFTATKLSGFKYRYIYNDDITGGNGFNWGFCIDSPTLISSGNVEVPGCASNPTPVDASNIVVIIGAPGNTLSWDVPTTGDPVISYDIFFGDTAGDVTNFFATVSENFDTIFYTEAELGDTFFWKVVPKNAGGSAIDCPVWSYTIQDPPPPPIYDVCVDAQELTVGNNFNNFSFNATTIGALSSGETPDPSCGVFGNGNDVWFKVTVPSTGNLTIETQVGDLTDSVLSVYSGSCGNLNEIGCNDDNPLGGAMSILEFTSLNPNDIIYCRVFEFGNDFDGTFLISAYDDSNVSVNDAVIDGFNMYPNPVNNKLNLTASNKINQVEIYNYLGQKVFAKSMNSVNVELTLNSLEAGIYVIKVQADNQISSYNFIKK